MGLRRPALPGRTRGPVALDACRTRLIERGHVPAAFREPFARAGDVQGSKIIHSVVASLYPEDEVIAPCARGPGAARFRRPKTERGGSYDHGARSCDADRGARRPGPGAGRALRRLHGDGAPLPERPLPGLPAPTFKPLRTPVLLGLAPRSGRSMDVLRRRPCRRKLPALLRRR